MVATYSVALKELYHSKIRVKIRVRIRFRNKVSVLIRICIYEGLHKVPTHDIANTAAKRFAPVRRQCSRLKKEREITDILTF